jgi:ribosomal subunit interface protein
MQIQINTDHNIEANETQAAHFTDVVKHALSRFSQQITRVEIHLSDENSNKNENHDKRCMIEARLEGKQPISVSHHGETLHKAVEGAADKLARKLDSTIERMHDQKTRGDAIVVPESPQPEE